MPGHPIPPAAVAHTRADVKKLEDLIDAHDVIFLLMDSRESRWLAGVVARAKGKVSELCASSKGRIVLTCPDLAFDWISGSW